MRTIAIVNQKGGCGKTTTAINLAAVLARRGESTLLVDMDPQAHCAVGLGVPEGQIETGIAEALIADLSRPLDTDSLIWEVAQNLDLMPSTVRLAGMEAPGGGLHELPDRDKRLTQVLQSLGDRYDTCLIDCPPTIGLLTFNALRAAREALIPVETGFFALKGAARQWATIQRTIRHIGRPIACHLLPTLHRPELEIARNILAAMRRDFAGQIVPIVIHEHEMLREAASYGQPVAAYAPDSDAHKDYERLADWLAEHRPDPAVQIEVMQTTNGGGTALRNPSALRSPPAGTRSAFGRDSLAEQLGRAAELAERVKGIRSGGTPNISTAGAQVKKHTPVAATPEPVAPASPSKPVPNLQTVVTPSVTALAAQASTVTAIPAEPTPVAHPTPAPIASQPPMPVPTAIPTAIPTPGGSPHIQATNPMPALAPVVESPAPLAEQQAAEQSVSHLFGTRPTSQGILFVQPGGAGRSVSIAGDFNQWSTHVNVLKYNQQLDLYQAIIPVTPGEHRYRLIIDGVWQADPYNPRQERNEYGETNSLLTVEPRSRDV